MKYLDSIRVVGNAGGQSGVWIQILQIILGIISGMGMGKTMTLIISDL